MRLMLLAAVMAVVLTVASASAVITPVAWKQSSALFAARDAAKLSNATGMDGTQMYLYNQDGVGGAGETTSADGKEWCTSSQTNSGWTLASCMTAGKVWAVFDLGQSYDLDTVKIWNFNWKNGSSNLSNRGVSQFDVYVRHSVADTTDGTTGGTAINPSDLSYNGIVNNCPAFNLGTSNPWQLALSNQTLTQAPNNDTHTSTSFDLSGNYGRFVAIVVDSYYGGGGVGLGKVRFEEAKGIAHQPDPARGGTGVEIDLSSRIVPGAISWLSPDNPDDPDIVQVFGYNVYMDTNQTRVANATPASADLLCKSLQSGGQTGTSFDPGANLDYGTTYYWRVDAVADLASVPGATIAEAKTLTGNVWSFDTMVPVDSPIPNDGGTNAALSAIMSWQTPVGANLTYDVYFGTDFDAVAQAGDIDLDDLLLLAEQWLGIGDLEADRTNDNKVDLIDFSSLASIWQQRAEDSPVFKGNQTGKSFNPVGLAEATQYYWRVDAVDASNNVYPGDVWTFSTYNTAVLRQQMLAKYDNEGVPYVLNNQKLPGYNPTGDPKNILAGQINSTDLDPLANSFNQRNEGAIYPLAFCYQNPNSIYYRNANVLYRILLALDYSCRAQGKNGGFNEKIDTQNGQYGWCGVTLPNGGNNTRTDGASTVMGFPFFCIGRAIVMLQNEPAFISALDNVYIDNDGNGTADVKRRNAYQYMFDNNINGGTQTGIIQCMMTGKCKGGHPNQDGGAMAAVQACNEAYKFLNNGTPYISQAALDHYRDHVLFDNASWLERLFDPTRRNWWTDKYMILEVGHGAEGYDTGYGNIPPSLLGSYARHTNDSVVGNFITNYMNGYQYFFVLDDAWPDGGYWEYRTSRRQGDCTMPLFAAGMSQPYHPGYALIYDKTLSKCAKNPSIFLNVPWSGGLESSALGELLNHWSNPVDSDYILPCNRPETFTYTDLEANLEVTKTGASPETVTWKAFNYDGATKTYMYEAP